MDCRQFQDLWRARATHGLSAEAHSHLAGCTDCTAIAEAEDAGDVAAPPAAVAGHELPSSVNAPSRRTVLAGGLAGLVAGLIATRRSTAGDTSFRSRQAGEHRSAGDPVEFIVVGSGAGGGPLACNLARAGHKVVLIEAGGDSDAADVSAVPFFSGFTTEDASIRWDYYVRHYADDTQQQRSSQYLPAEDGIWYPRVGSLGGCTLHSFMVDIDPSGSDWNRIGRLTGDPTWNADTMRGYFQQVEACRYVPQLPGNPSRHGYNGWQPTEMPDPSVFRGDQQLRRILRAAKAETGDTDFTIEKLLSGQLDPNDWRQRNDREGIYDIPLFTSNGARFGTRQLIQQTQAAFPENLIIKTHCLVTRVLFEGRTAIGVEYVEGERLYRADPNHVSGSLGPKKRLRCKREVILAAGTFNTPQILKLSGIGPADELDAHNIPLVLDRPGVGRNLQDRYEVGVVTDFNANFQFAAACLPTAPDDPCFAQWLGGTGPYTGYGAPGGILSRSATQQQAGLPNPDLLISIALTRFKGYYPGYSVMDLAAEDAHHQMTWLILKGHTRNHAGTIRLRSADPRDTPVINFHYFEEGSDKAGQDLESLVDAIEMARRMNTRLTDISQGDIWPGPGINGRDAVRQFVRDEAWGHHASCSCKMGASDDPMAVVDSKFRVHGTRRLRIVDASVFPNIPGYFILMPIYMISQKASDDILTSAQLQDDAADAAPFAPAGERMV